MKKRWLAKRGYFFLIDSMLALGVIAIGGFLVFSLYAQVPSKAEPAILSEDIMDFFANTKISGVNNPYAGLGGTLWSEESKPGGLCPGEQLTANGENSLLQQIGIFYEKSKTNSCYTALAGKFILELTKNILPQQYTFEFWIDGQLLYPETEQSQSKNDANVLIPSKKMVYGILNPQTGDLFGPYTAEVLVWQ